MSRLVNGLNLMTLLHRGGTFFFVSARFAFTVKNYKNMRKTGGDERRRVEMHIIDSLCKQWFLIANHILNMTADGITKKETVIRLLA